MIGTIPVISEKVKIHYGNLFRGLLFENKPLEHIAIVVPTGDPDLYYNGTYLLNFLASITQNEVDARLHWLVNLAPFMQWGYGFRTYNAFNLALAAMTKAGLEYSNDIRARGNH
jgi:hypothetical protein